MWPLVRKMWLGIALFCGACGSIGLGTGTSNDPAPSGTIVYSGTFATNSNEISGTVFVYHQSGSTYTIRLESFSASTASNLKVQGITANGETELDSSLKSSSGNQNYSVSGVASTIWSSVKIVSTAIASPNNILATALLD